MIDYRNLNGDGMVSQSLAWHVFFNNQYLIYWQLQPVYSISFFFDGCQKQTTYYFKSVRNYSDLPCCDWQRLIHGACVYYSMWLCFRFQIRHCNIVLSFFEPTESDPKPCKSSSPQEKSDSGIDLTNDQRTNNQSITEVNVQPPEGWRDNYEVYSDDDYEGDTSGTETDSDPFDEDYFLDVGIGELMLSTENMELSGGASSIDSSTWCSNQNKFSNILNNTRLPGSENSRQYKAMTSGVCQLTEDDVNYDDITKSILDINELRENSDTESQMVSADHLSGLESDDEFSCKPMAPTDMNHYYLSTNTDDNID